MYKKYDICCTFGVIPFIAADDYHDLSQQDLLPLSIERAAVLKTGMELGVLDAALHGYSHQTILKKEDGGYSEFAGLEYEAQLNRITDGKKYLEDLLDAKIITFIPPWNIYDLNIIDVLEKRGFTCLSADRRSRPIKKETSLMFLPVTCYVQQLREAVSEARNSVDPNPVIVFLMHEFDFLEVDKKHGQVTYQEFDDMLNWLSNQQDIRFMSIGKALERISDLSVKRYIDNSYTFYSRVPVPSFIKNKIIEKIKKSKLYLSSSNILNFKIRFWVYTVIFYVCIIIFSFIPVFFSGLLLFKIQPKAIPLFKYGSPIFMILFLIYTFHDFEIYFKSMVAIMILLGINIGIYFSITKLQK